MAYRRTENVARRLAEREQRILDAAQSIAAESRVLLPQCQCCKGPMRIRTIEVLDRHEEIRLACTSCGSETIAGYRLGK